MNHSAIPDLLHGQYEAIVELCQQKIAAHSQDWSSYWYLGLAHLLQDDEAEAHATWFNATLLMSEMADPIAVEAGLGELLAILLQETDRQLQLGQARIAERLAWQALELDETRSHTYWLLGHAVSLQGRLEEAIEHWQTAIDFQLQVPYLIDAYQQQGEIFQKLAQWNEAIEAYCSILKLQPAEEVSWNLHYNLGLCLAQQQQWQAASEQFDQAIQLQPNNPAVYGDRGWAQLQLGHKQIALADFQTAVFQKSSYAKTYCTWAKTLQPSAQSPIIGRNAGWLSQLSLNVGKLQQENVSMHASASQSETKPLCETGVKPPLDCYEFTREWAATQPSAHGFMAIDAAEMIHLALPKTIDRSVHFSFRFGSVLLPETFVAQISNGRFWLNSEQTSSAIFTADNYLLGDLSPEFPLLSPGHPDRHPAHHSSFRSKQLPSLQQVKGTVAVLAGLTADMYFHWMVDVLPRINLLERSGIDLAEIDYFLVNDRLPFQRETLQQLNIPSPKILAAHTPLHLQADRLIVPSYPSSPAWISSWVCQWLKHLILGQMQAGNAGSDRLYITRQHTTTRRIINELDVISLLQSIGFQCIALETLSVYEQATLFAQAAVIVAPHGGGLTNTVFCQPGTKIIELFSPNYVYPCYWLISNHLKLDYYYLTGILPEGVYLHHCLYPDARTEDIFINLEDLQAILAQANILR